MHFATPVMVNLMEEASLNAVEGLLPAGHQIRARGPTSATRPRRRWACA
ncbi:MAG: hypothetical protein KIT18_02450 [Burkholderiales bacterium]|nr:hypothetical protein [Burkholderiales bacterium]